MAGSATACFLPRCCLSVLQFDAEVIAPRITRFWRPNRLVSAPFTRTSKNLAAERSTLSCCEDLPCVCARVSGIARQRQSSTAFSWFQRGSVQGAHVVKAHGSVASMEMSGRRHSSAAFLASQPRIAHRASSMRFSRSRASGRKCRIVCHHAVVFADVCRPFRSPVTH
jgi:hypothetical protein